MHLTLDDSLTTIKVNLHLCCFITSKKNASDILPFLLSPWKLSALSQCHTYYLVTSDWPQLMHSGKEGMWLTDQNDFNKVKESTESKNLNRDTNSSCLSAERFLPLNQDHFPEMLHCHLSAVRQCCRLQFVYRQNKQNKSLRVADNLRATNTWNHNSCFMKMWLNHSYV